MYDVIVIGGGIVGTSALCYLSELKLKSLLLEAESDVGEGTTKANSGIVHAGYDCEPNTLKARFNREGNALVYELGKKLGVAVKKTGSFVLAEKDGLSKLEELKSRGAANCIEGLKIVPRAEIIKTEPNISDNIEYALYAPSGGVVSPYKLCAALADFAAANGAEAALNKKVSAIGKEGGTFIVKCSDGSEYRSRVIINTAGARASEINRLAGEKTFETHFRRGDYYLLDTTERGYVNSVCFQLPSAAGKGILVTPTVDGNILVGPTSIPVKEYNDTAVCRDALDSIKVSAARSIKNINYGAVIRIFAGVRSIVGDDFIVENGADKNFIFAAGICSPGLTAAPAIGKYIVEELLKNTSLKAEKKSKMIEYREPPEIRNLTEKELNKLIKKDHRYGNIVCRCERITEGEIVEAIHSPVPAVTVDALKRRTRATMGRCQGGFCTVKIMEILSRELGIDFDAATKKGAGSEIALEEIK